MATWAEMSRVMRVANATRRLPTKKAIRQVVSRHLLKRSPSGYSLVVPEEGVMYVSDGVSRQHDRWYVHVRTEPEYVMDMRRQEYLQILADVQEMIHKKHGWTVYLTSMLPTV